MVQYSKFIGNQGAYMRRRKLFLSFTGLLQQMHDCLLSQDDLNRGLYFFLCGHRHVFYTGHGDRRNEADEIFKDNPANGKTALKLVRAAFAKAIEEGRAKCWSMVLASPLPLYRLLNDLLETNGYPRLPLQSDSNFQYSRKLIAKAISLTNLNLDVVGPPRYLPFEEVAH